MDQKIKAQWVSALRSGQYQQTTKYLHRQNAEGVDTFCCLGVLSELAVKADAAKITLVEDIKEWDPKTHDWVDKGERAICYGPTTGSIVRASQIPPDSVCDWAGLLSVDPEIEFGDGSYSTLSKLNDTGHAFSEIADLIEEQL